MPAKKYPHLLSLLIEEDLFMKKRHTFFSFRSIFLNR
jgi:hypothetical protein